MDLLTPSEAAYDEVTRAIRFDIAFLAKRVEEVCEHVRAWLVSEHETNVQSLGLFGASTGGAAALIASTRVNATAVVSRGGRPDLVASDILERVESAVELIVGSRDVEVIGMNREAYNKLTKVKEKSFDVVPGATHLFEEVTRTYSCAMTGDRQASWNKWRRWRHLFSESICNKLTTRGYENKCDAIAALTFVLQRVKQKS